MHHNAPEDEAEDSFDLGMLRDRASYGLRALSRHTGLALFVAVLTLLGAVLVAWILPDRYRVETRLIAQRDDVIAMLSNPGRPVLSDETNPASRAVADMVLRRDNLLSIVRQTGLLQHWRANRSPLFRLKDWLIYHRQLDDEELTEVLVGTLDKRITVTAQEGGVITFAVVWNDAAMATKLSQTVLDNFIENRNVNEMAIVGESITLLEQRLAEAQKNMEDTLQGAKAVPRPALPRMAGAPATAPSVGETAELARLRTEINGKRRALDELATFRDRRVAELQAELAQQRATYSESHPTVANLRKTIDALNIDSPQMIQQRRDLAEMEARYVTRGGSQAVLEGLPAPRVAVTGGGSGAATSSLLSALGISRDPSEDYTRGRLAAAIARYYSVVDRLEAARTERDAARAGIKFRYIVVKPPLPPRASMTGTYKTALGVLGALAAPLVALAAAVFVELRRGRIVQQWQVERSLGLPVLATLPAVGRSR